VHNGLKYNTLTLLMTGSCSRMSNEEEPLIHRLPPCLLNLYWETPGEGESGGRVWRGASVLFPHTCIPFTAARSKVQTVHRPVAQYTKYSIRIMEKVEPPSFRKRVSIKKLLRIFFTIIIVNVATPSCWCDWSLPNIPIKRYKTSIQVMRC
jgi:hypothetical protein